MNRIAQTLGSYLWWTFDRGSLPYDVMVTLILVFVFLAPYKINFKDKPATPVVHQNQVTAYTEQGRLIYEVAASAVSGPSDAVIGAELIQAIRPVAGDVSLVRYEPVKDKHGHLLAYRAWVRRP